jgi:hypothetical protein
MKCLYVGIFNSKNWGDIIVANKLRDFIAQYGEVKCCSYEQSFNIIDRGILDLCQYFGHKKLNIFSLHDINT